MIGAEERRRLISRLGGESNRALTTVLKCVAGIALLIAAVAGPWTILSATGPTAPDGEQAMARPEHALAHGVAESRRIFDERRQRFDEARRESPIEAQHREIAGQADSHSDPGFQVRTIRHE